MGKRMYEDLKEILCHELNEITRRGDIDKESLDDVYKLSSAITMVESLMKKGQQGGEQSMEEYSNNMGNSNMRMPMWAYEGASNDSYRSNRGMSNERGTTDGRDMGRSRGYANNSNDYSQDGSYDSYESYRRGRGADGRYVSRDSYDSYDSYNNYYDGSNRSSYDSYDSYDSYERGYSRHTAEQKVAEKLKDILETTESPKVREAINQAMQKIKH